MRTALRSGSLTVAILCGSKFVALGSEEPERVLVRALFMLAMAVCVATFVNTEAE